MRFFSTAKKFNELFTSCYFLLILLPLDKPNKSFYSWSMNFRFEYLIFNYSERCSRTKKHPDYRKK